MRKAARVFLIVVSIINGLMGLVCGVMLIARPDGALLQMGALIPVIATFPLAGVFFRDFLWIGVVMFLALGVPNTVAAVLLLRRHPAQYMATLVAAVLLTAWCLFELVFMFNAAGIGFLVVAIASAAASLWLMRA